MLELRSSAARAQRPRRADERLADVRMGAPTPGLRLFKRDDGRRRLRRWKASCAASRWRMEWGRRQRELHPRQGAAPAPGTRPAARPADAGDDRPLRERAGEETRSSSYTDQLQTSMDSSHRPRKCAGWRCSRSWRWAACPQILRAASACSSDSRDAALRLGRSARSRDVPRAWPRAGCPRAEVPFMMLLLRGKAYLRMRVHAEPDRRPRCSTRP